MKKNHFLLFIIVVGLFTSCTKQGLMTYNTDNSIYFDNYTTVTPRIPLDTTAVSFAYAGGTNKDSTIKIYISATGVPTTKDRPYKLLVDESLSTAKAGVHFVTPAPLQSIKAGSLFDTVLLKLLRTADMVDNNYKIVLRLEPNENFNTAIKFRIGSANKPVSAIQYAIHVNDLLRKPGRWLDSYLGTFTRKKLFLLCELLNTTTAYLDTQAPVSDVVFYGRFMQRYLNQMAANGTPVYEADGSLMKMGPAVQ